MATYFSNCEVLSNGCILYYDSALNNPITLGYYSDGIQCYQTDSLGRIIAITPCFSACDMVITGVMSTDPTTVGGSDGTITIDFTTSFGPSTYKLDGLGQGAATSPLVITGLSSSIPYTIEITDANNCSASATVTLGETSTLFDADWIMATYEFTDGDDLDTRSRIAIPNIGQDTQLEYLGWSRLNQYPTTGVPIISWGGDNQGTGFESVLINVARFKELFPAETEFIADLRAFWYTTVGDNPVNVAVTLWKGGTPIHDGCFTGQPYCWTNPTATLTGTIASVPKVITLFDPGNANSSGERAATLKYDLSTFIVVLSNNDTTTPSV